MTETFGMREAVRFLGKYVRPYRRHFITFYVGWLLDTLLGVIFPILFGIMLDKIVYEQDVACFLQISGLVVIMSLYSCLLYYWIYAQHHYLMIMFTFGIKIDVFEQFMRIKPSVLKGLSSGEIVSLIQEYPAECMHFLIRGIIHQINNFIVVLAVLFLSFRIHVAVGGLMFILTVICSCVSIGFGKIIKNSSVRQRNIYGRYIDWLYGILEHLSEIKFMCAQNQVRHQFKMFSRKLFARQNQMRMSAVLSEEIVKGVFLIAQILIFFVASYLTGKNMLSIGTFTVIVTYFNRITSAISGINQQWTNAQTRVGYIKKLKEFMEFPKENPREGICFHECAGEISVENMDFSYGDQKIYEHFNLKIHEKEKIAITGRSGGGKSTLGELLSGMLEPDSGSILIDGINICQYSKQSLRKQLGILFQENLLFDGTIRANILLGNRQATETQIINALRASELEEYILNLPNGLDTIIGREGIKLSDGQKQRLAIAQICIRNPGIIILDEPTSALDSLTEQKIVENWKETFADSTVVLITHRKQPLQMCERIVQIGVGNGER